MPQEFTKLFATDDHPELIEAAGGMLTQFYDGTEPITKSASDVIMRDDIMRHMPPSTHFGVHAISMGAEEDYGCLARDTPILRPDGGHSDFGSIRVGSEVVSGEGHIKRVSHIFEYEASEVVKLCVGGMAKDITASVDHPFRVADFEQFICKRDRWRRCLPGNYGQQNICKRNGGCDLATGDYPVLPEHNYKAAQDIRPRDYLVYRLPNIAPEDDISEDEAVVIGYFLAEGSFSRNKNPNGMRLISGLRFDFDLAERDTYAAELVTAARNCGWNANIYGPYDCGPNEIVVVVNGRPPRARQYAEWFGDDGAMCKKIPVWFLGLPDRVRLKLVTAYLQGDGATTSTEQCSATTASYDLACGMQKLLWSLGVAATTFHYEVAEKEAGLVKSGFSGYRVNYAYTRVPEACSALLFGNTPSSKEPKVHLFIVGRDVFLPIRSMEVAAWEDKVYTLEVEDDHSYVSAGVWSRNCNRNADSASRESLRKYHPTFEKFGAVYREHKNKCAKTQSVGQIKIAKFNERMNRGELFFWVDKEKAPDMYKAAKDGKELSWSMSMKLPYDRCSVCDKKSRNRGEYCNHLKHNLGRYIDGMRKYAYARNEDDVKFFDMSEVKRRADRIATYLSYTFADDDMRKAASADDIVISGADWFEFENGASHNMPLLAWDALMLEKLARMEGEVAAESPAAINMLTAAAPSFRDHVGKFRNHDFRNLTGELAKRAAVLDFVSFVALVTGRQVSEIEKDAGCMAAKDSILPDIFRVMSGMGGGISDQVLDSATTPDPCGCSLTGDKDVIDRLMHEENEDLSLAPEPTRGRMMKVTVIKAAKARSNNAAEVDSYNTALVHTYGRYVVKAARQAGLDESPLSLRALVAMNLA